MYAAIAFIVILVFLIIVAVFAAQCCPASCCVFDPACCGKNACDPKLCNKTFIPFYGPTFNVEGEPPAVVLGPVLLSAAPIANYIGFTEGKSTGLQLQSDLATDDGGAAGYAAPFTSNGKVQDLTAWIRASVAAGTSVVTVALYVAKKSDTTPSFAPVLSTTFTVTSTEAALYSNQSNVSGASATVSAGDLYIVLVTASADTTLVAAGGGFNYRT